MADSDGRRHPAARADNDTSVDGPDHPSASRAGARRAPPADPALPQPLPYRNALPHPAQGAGSDGGQRGLLDTATRLFHEQTGARVKAVPYLERILAAPQRIELYRMVAACMLGEICRGQADFLRAQQFYELAIVEGESKNIPEAVRTRPRDFYADYRPRAALGLMLTMRRVLGPPERIRQLAKETRDRFAAVSADLGEQTLVLEGLLDRQLGECERARESLEAALGRLQKLRPPFSLLWPEHVKALLAQTGSLLRARRLPATRAAREILRAADTGPWSQAVAAATLLHVELDRALEDELPPGEVRQRLNSSEEDNLGGLLGRMEEAAQCEADPYLLSESSVLHAAWWNAAAAPAQAQVFTRRLLDQMRALSSPLCLLRAVEAAMMFPADDGPELQELRRVGSDSLNRLRGVLVQYLLEPELLAQYDAYLSGDRAARPSGPAAWLNEEIIALRLRTWP